MSIFLPTYSQQQKKDFFSEVEKAFNAKTERVGVLLKEVQSNPTDDNIRTARAAYVQLSTLIGGDIMPLLNALLPPAPQPSANGAAQAPEVDLQAHLA